MYGGRMYRRRGGSVSILLIAIFLGVAFGLGYLVYDNAFNRPRSEPLPTVTVLPDMVSSPVREPTVIATAVPVAREITFGAHFSAPTAGISSNIVQTYLDGTSWDVTELGPNVGHLEGTAWMSRPGNIVLAGHVEMSDGRPGIFANINDLNIGDPVYLTQAGEERAYQVTQKFNTDPNNLEVLYPSANEKVTLITCSNYDFFSDVYRERVIVIAERVYS